MLKEEKKLTTQTQQTKKRPTKKEPGKTRKKKIAKKKSSKGKNLCEEKTGNEKATTTVKNKELEELYTAIRGLTRTRYQ